MIIICHDALSCCIYILHLMVFGTLIPTSFCILVCYSRTCFESIYSLLPSLSLTSVVHTLIVVPHFISEFEGDPETHFFCRENSNAFAIDIIWQDPHDNTYNPSSTNNGNERIYAEGSRLSILNVSRNDTGTYRCIRNTEFAEGTLSVIGMYAYHVWVYTCSLYLESVIHIEVEMHLPRC